MVRFINVIDCDHDMVRASVGAPAKPEPAPVCTPCTGPCHGLSANAMWASYCSTCPFRSNANDR